jgi:acyl-CoA-binding protein
VEGLGRKFACFRDAAGGLMVELEARFQAALVVIQGLPQDGAFQPSNEMKLQFYAFYKQAREGPCTAPRPGFWDLVARCQFIDFLRTFSRAKHDAWAGLGAMAGERAKEGYIEALKRIIETMNFSPDVEKFIEVKNL